ncbi:MAG: LrgB family protein [Pseudomonadales bacterium]|jgi:putative effector of murein hydrolase
MPSPLLSLSDAKPALLLLTAGVFVLSNLINKKLPCNGLSHPLTVSVLLVIAVLLVSGIPYQDYASANQPLDWLIGPAVVSLAVPLYRNLPIIKPWIGAILLTVVCCLIANLVLIWAITTCMDATDSSRIALSTKSVTTPIALSVNSLLKGNPALAAALVMVTGISGALIGPPLLKKLKINDPRIKGVALGFTSHAIGTQRAFQAGPVCGAIAVMTMILTAIIVSLIVPVIGPFLAS